MKIDFLIIGAQKSATTALFKYLESHPALELPAAKEAPLFTRNVDSNAVDHFMAENFSTSDGKFRGKATPQYMCDDSIPARIRAHNPDMKLIAVLRDPIDRAWSHYRMNRRRETESRTFERAITEQMHPDRLDQARAGSPPLHVNEFESESEFYLSWGEYGRILKRYLKHFQRKQLLVIYTSELQNEPERTLDKVLTFLGVAAGFRPDCLGEVIHKGGSDKIVSTELKHRVRDFWPINAVLSRVPESKKQAIRYWFEQFNVKTSDEKMQLSEKIKKLLESHFADDARLLEQLTQTKPGW